jgi:hypothetical protein
MTSNIVRMITKDDIEASKRLKMLYNRQKGPLNLTQAIIAENTGWSQGFISHCMTQRVSMNMSILVKWATILNVDVHEIDKSFSKRFPQLQPVQIPVKNTSGGFVGMTSKAIQTEEYAVELKNSVGIIPAKTVAHFDPSKTPKVSDLILCQLIDTKIAIFGRLVSIGKTQLKIDTSGTPTTIRFVELEFYHTAVQLTLP